MLFKKTIEPNTLALLETLMQMPELGKCDLVGGTALALKFGHRLSIDLDLFSVEPFEVDDVSNLLKKKFGAKFVHEKSHVKWAVFCYINDIKVDIVKYPHQLLRPIENIEGIRMFSSEDIAAMKVNAILGRGAKKDFYDMVQLLQKFSLSEIIEFYEKKYSDQVLLISVPTALTYFVDADLDVDPISLNGQTWGNVKSVLRKTVNDFMK